MRADDVPDPELYRACAQLHQQAQAYRPHLDQRFEHLLQAKKMERSRRKRPVSRLHRALPPMPNTRLVPPRTLWAAVSLVAPTAGWLVTQHQAWWVGYISLAVPACLAVKTRYGTDAPAAPSRGTTASALTTGRSQTRVPRGAEGRASALDHPPALPAPRQPKARTGRH